MIFATYRDQYFLSEEVWLAGEFPRLDAGVINWRQFLSRNIGAPSAIVRIWLK